MTQKLEHASNRPTGNLDMLVPDTHTQRHREKIEASFRVQGHTEN